MTTGLSQPPGPRHLGVCSWSLRPRSPAELAVQVAAAGLRCVQLALDPVRTDPVWREERTVAALLDADVRIASGMMATAGEDYSTLESIRRTGGVRPDATWAANLRAARENAALAARLGIDLVTLHAGFLPHDAADPERAVLIDRLRALADAFGDQGVRVGFETGQETAETLLSVLDQIGRSSVGVNFDPANMILYGMGDPVDALRKLAPFILQVHIKDAVPTQVTGTWGSEVPAGQGAVRWDEFFAILRDLPRPVDLMIEREAGQQRLDDIITARRLVERALPSLAEQSGGAS